MDAWCASASKAVARKVSQTYAVAMGPRARDAILALETVRRLGGSAEDEREADGRVR